MLDWAKREGADIELTDDPAEAVTGADCVVTDTWVSMGQQDDAPRRKQLLGPYAVDEELMRTPRPGPYSCIACRPIAGSRWRPP